MRGCGCETRARTGLSYVHMHICWTGGARRVNDTQLKCAVVACVFVCAALLKHLTRSLYPGRVNGIRVFRGLVSAKRPPELDGIAQAVSASIVVATVQNQGCGSGAEISWALV